MIPPIRFHCAVCIYGARLKWLLPELSFSDRWSRGTRTLGTRLISMTEIKGKTESHTTAQEPAKRFYAENIGPLIIYGFVVLTIFQHQVFVVMILSQWPASFPGLFSQQLVWGKAVETRWRWARIFFSQINASRRLKQFFNSQHGKDLNIISSSLVKI